MVRVVLLALLLIPSTLLAEDVIVTRQGYRIYPVVKHMGSSLSFEGRCDQGPRCRELGLTGCLKNQKGEKLCLSATVTNAGGGGRLFSSTPVQVGASKSGWYVATVQAGCIQP